VLVTGGAGYLGSEVCRQASERGWEVVATQLSTPPPHGRPLPLDVRDAEAVERALMRHGPDVVVHTAYRMHDRDTIVRGSKAVADAARRCGARLLHLSTDLVFDGEHGAPYTEEDEPRPLMEYGRHKLEAERLVERAHPGALTVRTSLLLGPPDGPQEALAHREDVEFHADEIRSPIRVRSLAAALLELAGGEVQGVLHVAGPEAVSRAELAARLRGGPVRSKPTPPGRARNVALDSSRAAALLSAPLVGRSA
jgi:dTDP-4-dehydrorhamnose reductase